MFKLSEIKELIKMVDKSSIEEIEIENEGARLYLSKPKPVPAASASVHNAVPPMPVQYPTAEAPQQAAAPTAAAQPQEAAVAPAKDSNLFEITSPMVGTFYASPSPGADSYVKKGDKVKENTVVCIVEAMKLMNEIEAEIKGEIVEVLVENTQLVEFGQPLFLVKPE